MKRTAGKVATNVNGLTIVLSRVCDSAIRQTRSFPVSIKKITSDVEYGVSDCVREARAAKTVPDESATKPVKDKKRITLFLTPRFTTPLSMSTFECSKPIAPKLTYKLSYLKAGGG